MVLIFILNLLFSECEVKVNSYSLVDVTATDTFSTMYNYSVQGLFNIDGKEYFNCSVIYYVEFSLNSQKYIKTASVYFKGYERRFYFDTMPDNISIMERLIRKISCRHNKIYYIIEAILEEDYGFFEQSKSWGR